MRLKRNLLKSVYVCETEKDVRIFSYWNKLVSSLDFLDFRLK